MKKHMGEIIILLCTLFTTSLITMLLTKLEIIKFTIFIIPIVLLLSILFSIVPIITIKSQ